MDIDDIVWRAASATMQYRVMSDDYFDGASDADFLALAQQVDSGKQPRSAGAARGGVSRGGSVQAQSTRSRTPLTQQPTISSRDAHAGTSRPERSSAIDKTPRVSRPVFNSIIVNTRQVNKSILRPVPNL